MRNSCMAIRAELLYAVPVCFTNSCYTLRLLFKFRVFFFFWTLLPCAKLDLRMEFRDQICLIRSVFGVEGSMWLMLGSALTSRRGTGAGMEPGEALELIPAVSCSRSRRWSRFWWSAGRVEQGGEQRLGRACPALRSDLSWSSTRSPPGLAVVMMYLWLLWKQLKLWSVCLLSGLGAAMTLWSMSCCLDGHGALLTLEPWTSLAAHVTLSLWFALSIWCQMLGNVWGTTGWDCPSHEFMAGCVLVSSAGQSWAPCAWPL